LRSKKLPPPTLVKLRDEAKEKIGECIIKGRELLESTISDMEELDKVKNELTKWSDYNRELLLRLFSNETIAQNYERADLGIGMLINPSFQFRVNRLKQKIQRRITILESIVGRLELIPENESLRNDEKKVTKKKPQPNKKVVWVVHGRNLKIRNSIFQLLRTVGVKPLEWGEAKAKTNKASPFVGEILEVAFSYAQAVVVLLTGDDLAKLRDEFQSSDDDQYETQLTPQARPNVLFEAGMAMGYCPERTILVQIGKIRPFSDITGRHIIKFDGGPEKRKELIDALLTAGVLVDIAEKKDWLTVGDFTIEESNYTSNEPEKKVIFYNVKLGKRFTEIKNTILFTKNANDLYRELGKLRKFFIKHEEFLSNDKISLFFQKWLDDLMVERDVSSLGNWNGEKIAEMKNDLSKLEI